MLRVHSGLSSVLYPFFALGTYCTDATYGPESSSAPPIEMCTYACSGMRDSESK